MLPHTKTKSCMHTLFPARNNPAVSESYFEVELVNRLQSAVEKQRAQIKKLDQSVLDYRTQNDELRALSDRTASCNRDLRRKCRAVQGQLHEMIDERAEMTAKVRHIFKKAFFGIYG